MLAPAWAGWRAGVDLPPFHFGEPAALAFLKQILAAEPGTRLGLPPRPLSEGVAAQIWDLFMKGCAKELHTQRFTSVRVGATRFTALWCECKGCG